MLEILSPAGGPESVMAAVQNGADSVYLGFGEFNARRNAKNFTRAEFKHALEYCRVRGVKTYLTLNTLASDNELYGVTQLAKDACRMGIDAIIVGDMGVMMALRQAVPEVPLHGSTQMGVHNLEGVKMLAAMGFSRVVLARELSHKEIAHIAEHAPIETEVFVHGSLCVCYSGSCYMSAVIGRRSGNRGLCAQPCRLEYSAGGRSPEHLLSLKDNCLVKYMRELDAMGVTSVKIEGRMKRPEYSAIVTGIYSKAAHTGNPPTEEELLALEKAFSREGFTDGFYTGNLGPEIHGVHQESTREDDVIFTTARKNYLNGEYQRVPVRFVGTIEEDKPVKIAAMDDRKNGAVTEGPVPEIAFHKELTLASLKTQMYKTGGTPFYCAGVKGKVEPGLALPISAFNEMRRNLLAEILELRREPPYRAEGEFIPQERAPGRAGPPSLTISVMSAKQLSKELAELAPRVVYVPVIEFLKDSPELDWFLGNKHLTLAVTLPRIIHDNERKTIAAALTKAHERGVTEALCGNIGHIQFARGHGFAVRGDYGLNVYNSQVLEALADIGLKSAALSFELRLAQIRDLSKPLDTEAIVYGRLPLMITEACIVKNSAGVCSCDNFGGLHDRIGAVFPVVPEFGCRNVVLNSKKLFLADKLHMFTGIGLWAQRLMFTTENAV
ncbi:MAG: U32 family peptidase, partial [Oscillospiraceae bacterium]|nr:U32 family peptidase [Oscillospiraceae bacterium]